MAKNIVLCSDGTGNSAAKKGEGTNVWKLFRAVDVHGDAPRQLAFYDDGVGTESLKILKILGGAFGFGLNRNIRDLYGSLVSCYEPGDRIFLFGFSRGAFTVRSLAGLICRCGVVDRRRFHGRLGELVREAVATYKKAHRKNDPSLAEAFRKQYGVENPEGGPGCTDPRDVPIRMIGVWDTVDAVGLPVDELTDAFDKLFHFYFHQHGLHRCVEHGYQALAIDDERHTFHPLVWDETDPAGEKEHQKIEQVWFAGVHSNVGGGYPKDQMALVSLDWMMRRAEGCGLVLRDEPQREYQDEANVHGKLYDSRSGLSAYYRYRPRDVEELSRGKLRGKVKIHASVFERIHRNTDGYAPFNLPGEYEVVDDSGATPREERPAERIPAKDLAWDVVWWRRTLYFSFVVLSLLLVAMASRFSAAAEAACPVGWCFFDPLFGVAVWAAPAAVEGWVVALRNQPFWLFAFLAGFLLLLFFRRVTKRGTSAVSVAGWRRSFGLPATVREAGFLHRLARRIRRSRLSTAWLPAFKRSVLPWITLALFVALVIWLLWRLCVQPPAAGTVACGHGEVALPLDVDESRTVDFDTRCACQATRVIVEEGGRYRFEVEVGETWMDKSFEASPDGLTKREDEARLRWVVPFRRSWWHGWFDLVGAVGGGDRHPFFLGSGRDGYEATATGRLYLYVNDAVCYWCPSGPWRYYENNQGTARVTVTRLPAPGS